VAQQEAQHLLDLVHVPEGAAQLSSAPSSLQSPLLGVDTSAVDSTRFWKVSMPLDQTLTWLQGNPPSGLTLFWSTDASGSPEGYAYSAPATDAWDSADLDIAVASTGDDTSVIRADGVVDWLESSPLTDTASGQRMHVTVAAGCPASDTHMVGVTNSGGDLESQMLPSDQPTAGLLCSYDGVNDNPFALQTQKDLDAATARSLAGPVAQLPIGHINNAVCSCPADFGSTVLVALSYPGRADVDLWVMPGGCSSIANGFIFVVACGSPGVSTVVSKIAALVGE
jgi:hypothetical protein